MTALTIGMATYNDFDGVYFTVQSLGLYQDLEETEILVIDTYGCEHTRRFVEGVPGARYLLDLEAQGTAAPRDLVFREAKGDAVLCCDSHVLLAPGAIARLRAYYREDPETNDLLQGPLLYDDRGSISTHFEPEWRAQTWGTWSTDPRGLDPEGAPFDIPMQGLGVFSCRKKAWPGFNPAFRGFGGEEGYIHEKFRQRGGRTLCLPWLRWLHRFGRPAGVPYRLTVEDTFRNYIIGHAELGLDQEPVRAHFAEFLDEDALDEITREALFELDVTRLPLVSCVCPTYDRPPTKQFLLEEAIESFLRQTYPNKELLVINDCPDQELVCDAPGVRVVNVPARYDSLGEKYNAGIALARGDLIANWDDDDISLPWRLSLAVERMADADYFNPRSFWFMQGDTPSAEPAWSVGHNLSLFRRSAFDAAGGYPPISMGVDQAMDKAFRGNPECRVKPADGDDELKREDLSYIYRWGVSQHHLSATPDENYWNRIGERPVQAGRFVLRPHWRQDYALEVRRLQERDPLFAPAQGGGKSEKKEKPKGRNGKRARETMIPGVLYVAGELDGNAGTRDDVRPFPLLLPEPDELPARHVDRVIHAIDEAVIAGGDRLLIPRQLASWLCDHPLLVDYLSTYHELIEASAKTGIVYALRRSQPDQ